ncbi:hypothetical protein BD413DRAFT_638687 [Trametes elegans]|nr:hypothetical protein BD413DRAFT_638687 [Trametes elegans]
MGLLGAFTVLLTVFSHPRDSQQPPDPEKANGDRFHAGKRNGPVVFARNSGADNNDLNTNSTTRRDERRTSQSPIQPQDEPGTSSDDITLSGLSLYSRIKSYVWPSDEQGNDIESIVPNYRWTPIVSGIVIPFSILLEIPGLTERWYIRTENHKTVETRKNPIVLEVGLAFSIACALIANVALVLRFLEKRVQTVTLICIIFLTVHDVINIVAVTVFGVEHRFDDGFTYGEAFWMTLCSTVASTVTNVSLIVDLIRTPDFARRGAGLTRKQRSLMIIVIVLLVYIAFGALINSILLHQTFINGLYFSVVSIETIGFGDIVPHSTGARVWTCCYVVCGVVNIGVAIAMCRETVLEGLEIGYRRRMRDMRQRRREARRFRRWEARWTRAVEFRLREAGLPVWVSEKDERERGDDGPGVRFLGLGLIPVPTPVPLLERLGASLRRSSTNNSVETRLAAGRHRGMHLNVNALTNAQLEEAALEAGVPLEMFLDLGERRREGGDGEGHGLDGRDVQENGGIVPALAQTHAQHAFRENIMSGWPSHPQTPTHAQIGRMAAMVTKFAVSVAGRHAHASGLPPPDVTAAAEGVAGSGNDSGDDEGSSQPQRPPTSTSHAQGESGINGENNGRQGEHGHRGHLLDIKKHPAGKWLKDFSRGATQRSGWTYERVRTEMEAEEKRAYYVKLTIAWVLFFLFWSIGSGVFSATEGWPYGSAMYFCFLAFVTTGYGDFAPVTPAGRSIFVVWALFGVGTLTIVVSVLQEAGSSRYKSALHSNVFDKAVVKYRKRQLQEGKQRPRPVIAQHAHSGSRQETRESEVDTRGTSGQAGPFHEANDEEKAQRTAERLQESREIAQRELEALPGEIVRSARTFQHYMQFFVSGAADGVNPFEEQGVEGQSGGPVVPPDMRRLLDELAEMEHINERVKSEILQDEDARKTLFMLSLERSLKKMVTSAEKALSALADRDALASLAAAQKATTEPGPNEVPSRPESPGGSDPGSSSALPRTQSQPPTPYVYRRRVQHAPTTRQRRDVDDADGMTSLSDLENVSSAASSMTTGPR